MRFGHIGSLRCLGAMFVILFLISVQYNVLSKTKVVYMTRKQIITIAVAFYDSCKPVYIEIRFLSPPLLKLRQKPLAKSERKFCIHGWHRLAQFCCESYADAGFCLSKKGPANGWRSWLILIRGWCFSQLYR